MVRYSLGYFILGITALHWLRPDVSPTARVTSEYAVGRYGFVMTSAFFVFGVALAALAIGLIRTSASVPRPVLGVGLLLVAALATWTAAFFPVDIGAAHPTTTTGRVHRLTAVIAFASMTVAPLVLAQRFARCPHPGHMVWFSRVVGVGGFSGLLAIQFFFLEWGVGGLAQRIILALVVVWMFLAALRIHEASTDGLTTLGSVPKGPA